MLASEISQRPGEQNYLGLNWVRGKGLDTAFPLGPWLVTKDELVDLYASEISLAVNGTERQKSKIGEMVFKIDELIEYVSADITMVPGDVISTGTPLGVAAFTGVPFLKAGDVVEAEDRRNRPIEKLCKSSVRIHLFCDSGRQSFQRDEEIFHAGPEAVVNSNPGTDKTVISTPQNS